MWALRFLAEAGPDSSLSWLLYCVLGFFFLMVVVGWLVSRIKGSRLEVRYEAHKDPPNDFDDAIKAGMKSPKSKGRRRK